MAEEFEPVTTQEQLDKIVNAKLEENTNAVTKQFEGYVSPADMAEKVKGYETTIADLTAKGKAAEQSLPLTCSADAPNVVRAAQEYGLPAELSDRLSGEDEKSIRADAEKMSKYFKAAHNAPDFRAEGDPSKNSAENALRRTLEKLKGE